MMKDRIHFRNQWALILLAKREGCGLFQLTGGGSSLSFLRFGQFFQGLLINLKRP
jgi:hypothetical protein